MTHDAAAPSSGRSFDAQRGAVVCVALVVAALAYSFRLTSFLHAKDAVLAGGAILVAVLSAIDGRGGRLGLRGFAPLWIFLGAELVVHALLQRASVPTLAVQQAAGLGLVLYLGMHALDLQIRAPAWRSRMLNAVAVSALPVALLGLLQYAGFLERFFPAFPGYEQRVYSVFGNQDLFGGYVALGLAVLLGQYFAGRVPAGRAWAGLAVLMPALLISGSRSAWLAALAGALVAASYGRVRAKALAGLCGAALGIGIATAVLAPEATVERARLSFTEGDVGFHARMWLWDGTMRMIGDRPLLGVGPGNYEVWSPSYLGEALHASGGVRHFHNEVHTLHAHSDLLEVIAETGLIGALCVIWMMWTLRRCGGRAWGGLAAWLVFGLFNSTLHSAPHTLAALLIVGALLSEGRNGAEPGDDPLPNRVRRWGAYAASTVGVALACFSVWAVVVPSVRLNSARAAHAAGDASAIEAYARAVAYPWPQYEAAEEWAIVLLKAQRYEEAWRAVDFAAEGRDTGLLHFVRGRLAAEQGDAASARTAFEACLWRWPGYYPAWEELLEVARSDARSGVLARASAWLDAASAARLRALYPR